MDFHRWANDVRMLSDAIKVLQAEAESLGAPACERREWHELLQHKLLPQVLGEPLLVVAVVGGTNVGKSIVFNHLAGEVASGVSPLASKTRHPVCLAPPGFVDESALRKIFAGFELAAWQRAEDPWDEGETHRLFWRTGAAAPPRLLLLDTPDVDSDAVINWQRADIVRHAADVLVAVLTQQKYNDAAVKQFFRKAAEADKPVIVVFNQCDLHDDAPYWSHWLRTFVSETGASVELVYVLPHDRQAARELRLPFYFVGADGHAPPAEQTSLRDELAALRFDAIKLRTMRGALRRVVDEEHGLPAWLREIAHSAQELVAAGDSLRNATGLARVEWPSLPVELLIAEIQPWWDLRRGTWSRRVHGFYRVLGTGMTWPLRKAWQAYAGPSREPAELFAEQERHAIIEAIGRLFDELERLAQLGNERLRPRLQQLLGGRSRTQLLEHVLAEHQRLPAIDESYRQFLAARLDQWSRDNPLWTNVLHATDQLLAVARPALTVTLFVGGGALANEMLHQATTQVVTHTATQIATDAAFASGITAAGETVVGAAGKTLQQGLAQLMRQLDRGFTQQRAAWLVGFIQRELLGDLLAELDRGTTLVHGATIETIHAILRRWQSQ